MHGHANTLEKKEIDELEIKCIDKNQASIEDLMKLGQLYIEPSHEEDKAISTFKAILRREPHNVWAKYWLSYCYLHYLMDKAALLEAKKLLENVLLEKTNGLGAIYSLYAEVQQDLGERKLEDLIPLLEKSVSLEPSWVQNRLYLASAYEAAGRMKEAITQIEEALKNIHTEVEQLSRQRYYYEVIVTGRIISNSSMSEYRKKLERLRHLNSTG